MFLDHFKIFPFSSTLHSNKREWTTGTHTCAAWRYYVQKKKKRQKLTPQWKFHKRIFGVLEMVYNLSGRDTFIYIYVYIAIYIYKIIDFT